MSKRPRQPRSTHPLAPSSSSMPQHFNIPVSLGRLCVDRTCAEKHPFLLTICISLENSTNNFHRSSLSRLYIREGSRPKRKSLHTPDKVYNPKRVGSWTLNLLEARFSLRLDWEGNWKFRRYSKLCIQARAPELHQTKLNLSRVTFGGIGAQSVFWGGPRTCGPRDRPKCGPKCGPKRGPKCETISWTESVNYEILHFDGGSNVWANTACF